MPAAIRQAERPDEPPVKTIQTIIISKITDTVEVISRATARRVPRGVARSTSPADIA